MARGIMLRGIEVVLGADLTNFEKGLKGAQRTLNNFARQTKSLSSAMMPINGALSAIGALSVKAAIDFESAFAGVRKTVDATEGEFKSLEKQIRGMALQMPSTATAIADVAAAGGQMGIAVNDLEEFSNVMLKLEEATTLTATESANAFARLTAVMGTSVSEYNAVGSALVALGNNFATTESKIIAMSDRMIGAASIVGLTEDQTLALATALSSVGVEAQAGGTAMQKLLLDMQGAVDTGGAKLKIFDQIVRSTGQSFSTLFKDSPAKAIQEFLAGLAEIQASGGNVSSVLDELKYSEVRMRNAILLGTSAHKDFAKAIDLAATARQDATALDKEYEARLKTLASQIKVTKNSLTELGITIGEMLAPHILTANKHIQAFTQQIDLTSPRTKDLATALTGVATASVAVGIALPRIAIGVAALLTPISALIATLTAAGIAAYTFRDKITQEFELVKKGVLSLSATITDELELIKRGWQTLSGTFSSGGSIKDRLAASRQAAISAAQGVKDFSDQMSKVSDGLAEFRGMSEEIMSVGDMFDYSAESADGASKKTGEFKIGLDETEGAAKKTKDALASLRDQLADFDRQTYFDGLREQLQKGIGSLSQADFDSLKQHFLSATKDGVISGLDDSVKDTAEALELANKTASQAAMQLDEQRIQALEQGHIQSVQSWQTFFENAITGVTFSLEDALKQVAVGFAAQIAASMSSELGGLDLSSPQSLGNSLAKIFLGAGRPDGVAGPLMENGNFTAGVIGGDFSQLSELFGGANTAGAYVTAGLAAFDKLSKIGRSSEDTAKGVASGVGAGLGAAFGGPVGAMIGEKIGSTAGKGIVHAFFGGSDPQANARNDFASKLTEMLKGVGGLNLAGSDGPVKLDSIDILGGRNKFDSGKGGFDFLHSLSGQAQATFTALGAGFKKVFELKDGDAAQFGAILSENLLGDLDNARLLVRQLGVDFETLKGAILETAIAGDISWLEFNTQVAGLGDAFKPGLAALADVGTALESLKRSGARGFGAINDLRNLAQEAMEAGGNSLSDLTSILMAHGATAEEAQQIITAAAGRGIKDLQGLAGASDEVAGSIVGDLDALGFGFKELSADVLSVKNALDQINSTTLQAKDLQVNVKVNDPHGALGGKVSVPGVGQVETGATRSARVGNSRALKVSTTSSGNSYNIDARGADAGVEARILRALKTVEENATRNAVSRVYQAQQRGRF